MVTASIPITDSIAPSLRAAIHAAADAYEYNAARARINGPLGVDNPERAAVCAERAAAYREALRRLENLADRLGLFPGPCCTWAARGIDCGCAL